jgi:mannose-1-phosphate guanylyltransferase
MKAVVLIGGKGTRLRPLTYTTTKAMLPIANVPFVDRLIKRLESHGITEIIFAMNYLAEEMKSYLENQRNRYKARIICSIEPKPVGSAGAVKFNERYLDETFLLLNGDILTDLDYTDLVRFHREKKALVTVNIAEIPDPTRFGVVDMDSEGRVICWQEKPSVEEARSNWANVGAWAMEPEILSEIPVGQFVSLEREVFQDLVKARAPFYGYKSYGYWADIGTPESYLDLHRDILSGKIVEPIPGQEVQDNIRVASKCEVSTLARLLKPVVINCNIEHSNSIKDTVIWDNTVVGSGTSLNSSIVGRNVQIASNVSIFDAVVGDDCIIDIPMLRSAKLGPGTVLSRDFAVRLP